MKIYCKKIEEFAKRFWSKVLIRGEDDCWEWQNAIQSHGYGSVSIGKKGKTALAHRVAYYLTNGDFPTSLCVLHECDNRRCCNPNHLFLGTIQDNNRDMFEKSRHAHGERNGNSKLTIKDVEELRRIHKVKKLSYRKLGKRFGISSTTARGIAKGKYWKLPLAE